MRGTSFLDLSRTNTEICCTFWPIAALPQWFRIRFPASLLRHRNNERDVKYSAWVPHYHNLLGLILSSPVVYTRSQEIVPYNFCHYYSCFNYEGRSINKLQNDIMLSIIKILKFRNIRFAGNLIGDT